MNEETNNLIAKYLLSGLSGREYSDWAVSCLEQNLDTKNIRILASMFNDKFETEFATYFERALKELGWEFPDSNTCFKRHTEFIARQILDDKISPREGCVLIHEVYMNLYCRDYDFSDSLEVFHNLYWRYWYSDELESFRLEQSELEELDLRTKQEAARF